MLNILKKLNRLSKATKFNIACLVCLLLSLSAIWLKIYAMVAYILFVAICSFFYDTNEIVILGSFGAFFTKCFGHNIYVIVLMISLFIKCVIKSLRREITLKNHLVLPIIITVVLSFMLVLINFNINNIFRTFLPFSLLLTIEFYLLRHEIDLSFWVRKLIIVLGFSCCVSFIIHAANVGISVYYTDIDNIKRFSGLLPHMNTLSIWCASLMSLLLYLFFSKKIGYIQFYGYLLLVLVMGLASVSKSFLLIGAVLLIIYLIGSLVKNWKFGIIQIIVLAIGVVCFCVFCPDILQSLSARFIGYSGKTLINKITTGRYAIWVKGINAWLENAKTIIFGVGGTYKKNLHNTYIEILVKYGVVGALLVCVFIAYFVVLSMKNTVKKFYNYIPLIATLLYMLVEEFSTGQFVTIMLSFFAIYNFAVHQNKNKVLIFVNNPCDNDVNKELNGIIGNLSPGTSYDVLTDSPQDDNGTEIKEMLANDNCEVISTNTKNKLLSNIKQIRFFIKHKGEYDAVLLNFTNKGNGRVAYNARIYGEVDNVIANVHINTDNAANKLDMYLGKHYISNFIFDSTDLAIDMFGEKYYKRQNVAILNSDKSKDN